MRGTTTEWASLLSPQDASPETAEPRLPWMEQAVCAGEDVETFYPESNNHVKDLERARKLCASCPVFRECIEFGVDTGDAWGVFGGTTPKQRAQAKGHPDAAEKLAEWFYGWGVQHRTNPALGGNAPTLEGVLS